MPHSSLSIDYQIVSKSIIKSKWIKVDLDQAWWHIYLYGRASIENCKFIANRWSSWSNFDINKSLSLFVPPFNIIDNVVHMMVIRFTFLIQAPLNYSACYLLRNHQLLLGALYCNLVFPIYSHFIGSPISSLVYLKWIAIKFNPIHISYYKSNLKLKKNHL